VANPDSLGMSQFCDSARTELANLHRIGCCAQN